MRTTKQSSLARQGAAGRGEAWPGKAGPGRVFLIGFNSTRRGKARRGKARRGLAWPGADRELLDLIERCEKVQRDFGTAHSIPALDAAVEYLGRRRQRAQDRLRPHRARRSHRVSRRPARETLRPNSSRRSAIKWI